MPGRPVILPGPLGDQGLTNAVSMYLGARDRKRAQAREDLRFEHETEAHRIGMEQTQAQIAHLRQQTRSSELDTAYSNLERFMGFLPPGVALGEDPATNAMIDAMVEHIPEAEQLRGIVPRPVTVETRLNDFALDMLDGLPPEMQQIYASREKLGSSLTEMMAEENHAGIMLHTTDIMRERMNQDPEFASQMAHQFLGTTEEHQFEFFGRQYSLPAETGIRLGLAAQELALSTWLAQQKGQGVEDEAMQRYFDQVRDNVGEAGVRVTDQHIMQVLETVERANQSENPGEVMDEWLSRQSREMQYLTAAMMKGVDTSESLAVWAMRQQPGGAEMADMFALFQLPTDVVGANELALRIAQEAGLSDMVNPMINFRFAPRFGVIGDRRPQFGEFGATQPSELARQIELENQIKGETPSITQEDSPSPTVPQVEFRRSVTKRFIDRNDRDAKIFGPDDRSAWINTMVYLRMRGEIDADEQRAYLDRHLSGIRGPLRNELNRIINLELREQEKEP